MGLSSPHLGVEDTCGCGVRLHWVLERLPREAGLTGVWKHELDQVGVGGQAEGRGRVGYTPSRSRQVRLGDAEPADEARPACGSACSMLGEAFAA